MDGDEGGRREAPEEVINGVGTLEGNGQAGPTDGVEEAGVTGRSLQRGC